MAGDGGPTISVVMPVRNGERYLREALDSVLAELPPDGEIVVVDDDSTDGTAAILDTYAPQVRALRQPASGNAAALNRGVRATRGALIAFCDADDRWVPGRLATQLDRLASDPTLDVVGGLVRQFVSPDVPDVATAVRVDTRPRRARLVSALVCRRAVFERVGWFDERLAHGAPTDWVSRADAAGVVVGWVDVVVLERRIHDRNIGHDQDAAYRNLLRILRADRRRRVGDEGSVAS